MGYSDDEIRTAVEKVVRSSIRRPLDTLGVRRQDVTFSDVQEAVAGVFILYPNSPFYIVSLGAKRLYDVVTEADATVSRLLTLVRSMGRAVLPVSNITPLFNARSALRELAAAASSRTQGFRDITKAPAHVRFEANVNQFLQEAGSSIKEGGDISETPQEAQTQIPVLVRTLQEQYASLLSGAASLAAAMDDYGKVGLPSLVASGVLSRSASVIEEKAKTLEALDKTERLAHLRNTVLDLLATKAAVRTFGSFSGPGDFVPFTGTGTVYADSAHPADAATVTSDYGGAFPLLQGNTDLVLAVDGGAPITLELNPSPVAELISVEEEDGSPSDGWRIGDGTFPTPPLGAVAPNNNVVKIRVAGVPYTKVLTVSPAWGTNRTAEQIATELNTVLPVNTHAEAAFRVTKYDGQITIPGGSATAVLTAPPNTPDFDAELTIAPGDLLRVKSGTNTGVYEVTAVTASTLTIARTSGVFSAQTSAPLEVGPRLRVLRIYMDGTPSQVIGEETLEVYGDTPESEDFCSTLGFFNGITSSCRMVPVTELAEDVRGKTALVVPSIVFEPAPGFSAPVYVRSSLADSREMSFVHTTGVGDASFSGTTLTLTVISTSRSKRAAAVGDIVVLRSGPNAGEHWSVSAVNGSVITATGVVFGTMSAGISFELGDDPAVVPYDTIFVPSGPNAGSYYVEGEGGTPLDILLRSALPIVRSGPSEYDFTAQVGGRYLVLTSTDRTQNSSIQVSGAVQALLFSTPSPTLGTPTFPWLQLTSFPRELQEGDLLELYSSQYNVADSSHVVGALEKTSRLVRISPSLPSSPSSWAFGEVPLPLALFRRGRSADFNSFKQRLDQWLAREENQEAYFVELNRYINPLLSSSNPTAEQVGSAVSAIYGVYKYLTAGAARAALLSPTVSLESALLSYVVPPVSEVDALLALYRSKGSDRALDVLLQGGFSEFFSMSMGAASYSGAVQEAMREVAREDVPVRRTGRAETAQPRVLSQTEVPDREFDTDDSESLGSPESL